MRRLSIYLEELREQLEWSEENSGQTSTANRARLREHTGEEKADDVVTLNITGKANPPSPASIRCETGGEAEERVMRLSCVSASGLLSDVSADQVCRACAIGKWPL